MAFRRLSVHAFAPLALVLAGCGQSAPAGPPPAPQAGDLPASVNTTMDVDQRATLALRQALATRFAANAPTAEIEAALTREGYVCGANPAVQGERGCLKIEAEGACRVNSVVRADPWRPERARVIRACPA